MKKISIIIPTINRYQDLKNTVGYLKNQTIQNFEIIIIDQTPKQKFQNLESIDNRIIHIWSAIKSASAARNIGIRRADSAILLFLDDDVIIENNTFLATHLQHFEAPKTSGVFGAVLDVNNPNWRSDRHQFSRWKNNGWLFFPPNFNQKAFVKNGGAGNLSVRKSWTIDVGGMNEQYVKGAHREESDFCLRYTKKYGDLIFDPNCYLIHIGNKKGGIRSWNKNIELKAQHNFDGAIYFIFQCVHIFDQPLHWLVTTKYFFNKKVISRSDLFFPTLKRFSKGILNGIKMRLEGPKYLK